MSAKKAAKKAAKKVGRVLGTEFEEMLAKINKERGNVITTANLIPAANHIPTGCFMLDYALLGGIPDGYCSMLFGYESCLHPESFIPYKVEDANGKTANTKGGTIEKLYRRFHNLNYGKAGDHLARRDVDYYVLSVDENNSIIRNRVVDVVRTGKKIIYAVKVGTKTLRATMNHRFLTPNGYRKLSELSVGDEVMMHSKTFKGRMRVPCRPEISVNHHPNWGVHGSFDTNNGKWYSYHRAPYSHAAYEAGINGLPVYEYVRRLNAGELDGLVFITPGNHIHHEDGNWDNNDFYNLTMLTPSEHGLRHADDCSTNTRYIATPGKIKSIKFAGRVDTYDVKCAYPYNNYVAESFVVHNCGKSFMSLQIVSNFQKKYPDKQAVWIDAEGMFDPKWAEMLGIDLSRLHVVRPETGNVAVDMIEALMEPMEVGLVILDSIPGMVPQRIAEKSAEDQTMGELARLLGIMCSKIYCSWATERRRNHWVTLVLINQWRMKIGQMFGDPRTLPGGRQINHLPTTKIELKNNEIGGKDNFDSHMMIRNEHSFKIVKAKHGRSVREGEFHVSLSHEENDGVKPFGFINHKTVVAYCKKLGLLGGGGGKYRIEGIPGETFRTLDDAALHLVENPKLSNRLQRMLISMQRVDKGLSALPMDGYLVAPLVKKPPTAAGRRIIRPV